MVAPPSSPPVATDKPPRTRRWIPLSVRIFAVMLGLLAIGSLWIAVPAYRQYVAILEIERVARVTTKPAGYDGLRRLLGADRMRGLDEVTVVEGGFSDGFTDAVA